jgi:uncharacterized alkaline shock family protein YloU
VEESKIKEKEMGQRLWELNKVKEIMVGGETTIDDDVIAAIAGAAAQEVQGVASMGTTSIQRSISESIGRSEKKSRGVEIEAGKKEAIIDLTLNITYGFNIPNIIIDVRKTVATRLLDLCGMVAKEVNVTVAGIEFPERMPGKLE